MASLASEVCGSARLFDLLPAQARGLVLSGKVQSDIDNANSERTILGPEEIRRSLTRIAHEILERNGGGADLVLIGIHTRGVPLAARLADLIGQFEGKKPPVGGLDISLYRDDLLARASPVMRSTDLPASIEASLVVLVDDVLFTGRTIRAAMDALTDFGRPRQIHLAVLVDRGHRELPIKADYVGKNIPTSLTERVCVRLAEIDRSDEVVCKPVNTVRGGTWN